MTGGSVISLSVRWIQKLTYGNGQFSISIPFTFPEFVNPSGKTIIKKEKIKLNINGGSGKEILCQLTSHALKVRYLFIIIVVLSVLVTFWKFS